MPLSSVAFARSSFSSATRASSFGITPCAIASACDSWAARAAAASRSICSAAFLNGSSAGAFTPFSLSNAASSALARAAASALDATRCCSCASTAWNASCTILLSALILGSWLCLSLSLVTVTSGLERMSKAC
eukprot:jgi/Chrpa1/9716/Chrysochromulina_OHIO_Genome00015481-RA